jgi:hypothetical protein
MWSGSWFFGVFWGDLIFLLQNIPAEGWLLTTTKRKMIVQINAPTTLRDTGLYQTNRSTTLRRTEDRNYYFFNTFVESFTLKFYINVPE